MTPDETMFPERLFPIVFHDFKYIPSARPIQPRSLVLYANVENGIVTGHWLCLCIEINDDGTYTLRSKGTIIIATVDRCIALTHTVPIASTEKVRDVFTPVFYKRDNRFDYDIEVITNPFIVTYN